MTARARNKQQSEYPQHEHADKHTLLRAQANVTSRRRLRDAAELRPCGEVGAERLREYLLDLGAEYEGDRWRAEVCRTIGLNEDTGRKIIRGVSPTVSTRTIDVVAQTTGIPISAFLDPEYEV